MNHTPTPWEVIWKTGIGNKDVVVADADCLPNNDENEANAAFIVRACNAHDILLTELNSILGYEHDGSESVRFAFQHFIECAPEFLPRIRTAIKYARGE